MIAVPLVGGSSVTIMRISVDLPAPFGPSRPKISPALTSKLTSLTAVKSPNFLTMSRTSMADCRWLGLSAATATSSSWRQQHVCGHADGEATIRCCRRAADFERLDVALGPADVALRGEAGVGAAVEDRALALGAGRQTDGQLVADADAIDVGLLDIDAHPEVVRIDQRDDRLPGRDDLARQAARTSTMPSIGAWISV